MKTKWFPTADRLNVTELRSAYRVLCMANHPDLNPTNPKTTVNMQEINAEYQRLLSWKNGEEYVDEQENVHTYYYNQEHEEAIAEKLAEMLAEHLPGCTIRLIGKWIWIEGETRHVKDTIKAHGFRWNNKRVAWSWKPYAGRTRFNSRANDLDDLESFYGGKKYAGKSQSAAFVS